MCANCPTSIFRKYVSWTKSGPAKAGPAGPLATALKGSTGTDPTPKPQFWALEGWLQKFLNRQLLYLWRTMPIQQKLPVDLERKSERFMQDVMTLKESHKFSEQLINNILWYAEGTNHYQDRCPWSVSKGHKRRERMSNLCCHVLSCRTDAETNGDIQAINSTFPENSNKEEWHCQ